jgi:hypothetical protein
MSRSQLRSQLYTFLDEANITDLIQVHSSFPNRIDFQRNAVAGQKSRAVVVIFIESERESRLAFGGATSGKKRIDYNVAVQVYHHSLWDDGEKVMADFDKMLDGLKDRLRSDHRFGDTTGTLIWQGAEPQIEVSYGLPKKINGGATETWASVRFAVTQMLNA